MKFSRLPLTFKLATIHALLAVSLVAMVVIAWNPHSSSEEALEVAQLGQAQRATQNADMMHDALHADLLAAMLVADQSAERQKNVRDSVRSNARDLRADLALIETMSLNRQLEARFTSARDAAVDYVEQVEHLVPIALSNPSRAKVRLDEFDVAFEKTKEELASLTALIAKQVDAAGSTARQATDMARRWLLLATLFTVVAGWFAIAFIARSIRGSLMEVRDVARAVAAGELDRRSDHPGRDEVGQIALSVNQMADALSNMLSRTRAEADRSEFSTQLMTALDMADSEAEACQVVARAMKQISPGHAMELLLSDSSDAHLERAAEHPGRGAPGCGVDSPYACVAVRRGHAVSFEHSDALDACPKLRDRPEGILQATCVPVTFMGRALGVLHAAGPIAEPLGADACDRLNTLGTQIGARVGTVRAFESTQVQARTDSLTGLANRRAAENRMRELLREHETFAVVMADLDRFKLLNDTHGHQTGDEALRVFSAVTRDCMRQSDLPCRWGGEEFCFLLVHSNADQAMEWVDRVRARLARELEMRTVPVFTASFGIVDSTMELPMETLIGAADMALYRAKNEGRDRGVRADASEMSAPLSLVRHSEPQAAVDLQMLANADGPREPPSRSRKRAGGSE